MSEVAAYGTAVTVEGARPAAAPARPKRMRHERSITSLSWIPSEAIDGSMRRAFVAGITHYDPPPPDGTEDIETLRNTYRFRFANVLKAWIEVDDEGWISAAGYDGGGLMGTTTVRLGQLMHTFEAIALPDLRSEPERGDGWVRFQALDRSALRELSQDHRRRTRRVGFTSARADAPRAGLASM